MTGLSASTGRAVDSSGDQYEIDACIDVLTTPIGSCVMNRDYGSWLPELVDRPLDETTRLQILGATAMALHRWRPRSRLKRVQLRGDGGQADLQLQLVRRDRPRPSLLSLNLPLAAARRA